MRRLLGVAAPLLVLIAAASVACSSGSSYGSSPGTPQSGATQAGRAATTPTSSAPPGGYDYGHGYGSSSPTAAATAAGAGTSVSISGFAFHPAAQTVKVGSTVRWTNDQQGSPHTVTSDKKGLFDSGTLQPGSGYSFTFSSPGTFTYHCSIHPSMKGTVVVTS